MAEFLHHSSISFPIRELAPLPMAHKQCFRTIIQNFPLQAGFSTAIQCNRHKLGQASRHGRLELGLELREVAHENWPTQNCHFGRFHHRVAPMDSHGTFITELQSWHSQENTMLPLCIAQSQCILITGQPRTRLQAATFPTYSLFLFFFCTVHQGVRRVLG